MFNFQESLRNEQILEETDLSPDDEFSDEYAGEHTEEIEAMCWQMAHEADRRERMEQDAGRQVEKYQREMRFHGAKYREMKTELTGIFREGTEMLYTPEVYQAVANGMLSTLGVEEERLPKVRLITDERELRRVEEREQTEITAKGRYVPPRSTKHDSKQGRRNGRIDIFLPNFRGELEPEQVLTTLGHECYHAYQENRLQGRIEPETLGEAVASVAYKYGKAEYVKAKRARISYRRQGFETSARLFGEQAMPATFDVIQEAIKES